MVGKVTESDAPSIRFLGGAGTVTGSKFLIEAGRRRVLVDCGLFQGYKQLRLRNWKPLPIAPEQLDAVILTHAHLDHSGWLPVLVRDGYAGPVHATAATADLCRYLLPDAGFIHEKDAAYANRHGFSKHHPARPLYTRADAEACLRKLKPQPFHEVIEVAPEITLEYRRAGHIIGAASALLDIDGRRVLFSGDLGPPSSPIMPPPDPIPAAEWIVVESTYGNRDRNHDDAEAALERVIRTTVGRGGTVLIPAFAVGRTQVLLYHLDRLMRTGRIPRVPVYLDSPLAINATGVFADHPEDHRLTLAQAESACALPRYVQDTEASKSLDHDPMPKIIIAGSGMATGGRILHHLKAHAPQPQHTILFAGYQAGGTRGAALVAGAEQIKIHGQYWPVKASVENLEMLSAHADGGEILDWLGGCPQRPRECFVVHGEAEAADTMRHRIEERLGWNATVPEHGERVRLER